MTEPAYTALDLSRLVRLYAALSPATPSMMPCPPFPTPEYLARTHHQAKLFELLAPLDNLEDVRGNSLTTGCRWKYAFWKRVIDVIEQTQSEGALPGLEDEEIDTRILLHYISLQRSMNSEFRDQSASEIRRYFYGPLGDRSAWRCVSLMEDKASISKGTTGLRSWGASVCLANYLLSNPGLLVDRQVVLELGSGTGLVGILAHQISVAERRTVYLTDVDPFVLERLNQNVELNKSSNSEGLHIRTLDWISPMEWKDLQPNLILAADVVYDPSLVLPLAKTFRVLLSGPGKPRAFLSATIRHEQTWKDFLGCCQSELLKVQSISVPSIDNDNGIVTIEGLDQNSSNQLQLIELRLSSPEAP